MTDGMGDHLTDDQTELLTAVRTLLERRGDSLASRRAAESADGFDAALWTTLAQEIGAAALAIPEEFDGIGASLAESHLVAEAIGFSLAPAPYLGSVAIAAQAILLAGDDDASSRLLPAIAAGESIAALVWADPLGRWSPETMAVAATGAGESWVLDGESPLVLEGAVADVIVVVASTPSGPGLFEVVDLEAVEREVTPAVDGMTRFATLRFAGVAARPLLVDDSARLSRIRDTAIVAIASTQVGVAARGLSMTVEYSKQREQFGRAIGSFQALKHRMADMHVGVESARSIARAATAALVADGDEAGRLAPAAKAWCGDALDLVAGETIQIHGGIAITWEHDAQLLFKRAHVLGQLFGTAADQRRRIADDIGLTPAH